MVQKGGSDQHVGMVHQSQSGSRTEVAVIGRWDGQDGRTPPNMHGLGWMGMGKRLPSMGGSGYECVGRCRYIRDGLHQGWSAYHAKYQPRCYCGRCACHSTRLGQGMQPEGTARGQGKAQPWFQATHFPRVVAEDAANALGDWAPQGCSN